MTVVVEAKVDKKDETTLGYIASVGSKVTGGYGKQEAVGEEPETEGGFMSMFAVKKSKPVVEDEAADGADDAAGATDEPAAEKESALSWFAVKKRQETDEDADTAPKLLKEKPPLPICALPATGVYFDFWDGRADESVDIAFAAGPVGVGTDYATKTVVEKVLEAGQAEKLGVVPGMRFVAIDNEPYTHALFEKAIAFGKGFTATFSKVTPTASSAAPKLCQEAIISGTFAPSKVDEEGQTSGFGAQVNMETGRIEKVDEGGQADLAGIAVDMRFKTVRGEPATAARIKAATSGEVDFQATFVKGPVFDTEAQNAIYWVSRCSRSFSYPSFAFLVGQDWQLDSWEPEGRVPAYLARFGLQAESLEKWTQIPSDSSSRLRVKLESHVEQNFHTWYVLECTFIRKDTHEVTVWPAPRRLCQLRTSLYDRVKKELGSRYDGLFQGSNFASQGGFTGTTEKLTKWMACLMALFNDGILSPELSALMLFFLQAPITGAASSDEAPPLHFY